jgi:hypothetical protein
MKRQVIRALVALGLFGATVATVAAQNTPDTVEVRNRKDGSTKTYSGQFKLSAAGFQVFTGAKFDMASEAFSPDDIVRVAIGDLPGVDRGKINSLVAKEAKKTTKDYTDAAAEYADLAKKGTGDRSKRYLTYKSLTLSQKVVDELDGKEWQTKADDLIASWKGFQTDYKAAPGWELWPGTRSMTRLQVERGKYDDAAGAWEKLRGVSEMPPDAKLEAGIQEVDLRIRGKTYPNAAALADELQKVATGARKERLAVYAIAAKAASDGKYAEGVDRIRSEMDKSKDPAVHATGYGMMGELYLAAGKSRDAMWMFLWVETVVNQDRDETFKALCRLADLFEKPGEESPLKNPMADEDQAKKYREKLKRFRAMF